MTTIVPRPDAGVSIQIRPPWVSINRRAIGSPRPMPPRLGSRESHDPSRGGIGLGLPIARRLIETQGGRIWIDTPASGRGTMVVMTLPASSEMDLKTQNGETKPVTLEAQQRTA